MKRECLQERTITSDSAREVALQLRVVMSHATWPWRVTWQWATLHLLKKIQLQFCMITFKMWNAILLVLVVSLRLNRNESATFRCFGLPSGVTIPQTMRSIRPSWKVPPVPPHGTAWCWWKKSDPVSVGSLSQYLRWGLYKSLKWCKIARYVLSTVFVDFGNVEVGSTRFGWSCSNSQANLS